MEALMVAMDKLIDDAAETVPHEEFMRRAKAASEHLDQAIAKHRAASHPEPAQGEPPPKLPSGIYPEFTKTLGAFPVPTSGAGAVEGISAEQPIGYAYRYPDGIRFNTAGRYINGSKPIETIELFSGGQVRQLLDDRNKLLNQVASQVDKLRELRKERDALKLQNKWIPVSERLPEFEEYVWALLPTENGREWCLAIVMRGDGDDGWLWSICDEWGGRMVSWPDLGEHASFECDDDYRVKYWLPLAALPNPPVEGERQEPVDTKEKK